MIQYSGQPTLHADAWRLALPVAQLYGLDPRTLPAEHLQFCCDLAAHYSTMAQLDEALGSLPLPMEGSNSQALKDQSRNQGEYEELMLQRIQEDCCFHLPLDHKYGERLDCPILEHWKTAPGVLSGPTYQWGPKAAPSSRSSLGLARSAGEAGRVAHSTEGGKA